MKLWVSNVYEDMMCTVEARTIMQRGEPVEAKTPEALTLEQLKEDGMVGAYVEIDESLYNHKIESGMCEKEIVAEALGDYLAQIYGYGDYII